MYQKNARASRARGGEKKDLIQYIINRSCAWVLYHRFGILLSRQDSPGNLPDSLRERRRRLRFLFPAA
jgi:hypothetical protein